MFTAQEKRGLVLLIQTFSLSQIKNRLIEILKVIGKCIIQIVLNTVAQHSCKPFFGGFRGTVVFFECEWGIIMQNLGKIFVKLK